MALILDDAQTAALVKSIVYELTQERHDWLYELIAEALEEIGMAEAIQEGRQDDLGDQAYVYATESDLHIPTIAFVGRSGSGKTTLLARLLPVLRARGLRVAVVKHTRHAGVDFDAPGSDTRRFWDAGADCTVLVAPDFVMRAQRHVAEPPLAQVLASIHDVDLIILEGFKRAPGPKIEVVRATCDPDLLPGLEGRIACVTDVADLDCAPRFPFDALDALADFIERSSATG